MSRGVTNVCNNRYVSSLRVRLSPGTDNSLSRSRSTRSWRPLIAARSNSNTAPLVTLRRVPAKNVTVVHTPNYPLPSGASERFRKWWGYKFVRTLSNRVVKVSA